MKKNYLNLIIIFIVATILLLPLWTREYRNNDDTSFHIANISATIDSMGDNFIPKDILPDIAGNYGYATRQFYPVIGHTTAAYISKGLNIDITTSLKITYTIILFLSGVTMYYFSLHLSKSKKMALLSSIIYMSFPYHLSDIYVRDALAETFVFIFLPMILDSLLYLFTNKRRFYALFVIGYVGGMISHFTMMIYFTVFLIPFFIIYRKKIFKFDTIKTLIVAALFILGITAPVITNMFQNKLFGDYMVFYPEHMAQGIWHSGVTPIDLFDYIKALNGSTDIHLFLNIIVLILLIITIINRKKLNISSDYKFYFIFGIISFICASIIFPWDILPNGFRIIQFPWRLMTFVAIIVSLFAPLCLKNIITYKPIIYYCLVVSIVLIATIFDTNTHSEIYNIDNIDYSYGMGWQKEYLPYNAYTNYSYLKNRNYGIITSSGTSSILSDNIDELKFTISSNTTVELPRIYYFGYYLIDSSSNIYDFEESNLGLIKANLAAGEYTLVYKQTDAIRISNVICFITLGTYAFYVLFKRENYG